MNDGRDASASFEQGNVLAAQGDLDGAEDAYRRADESGHPTAAAYVGMFSEAHGDLGAAVDAYRRADKRGDGLGSLRLGLLLGTAEQWDEAKPALLRADERGHDEPPFDMQTLRGGRSSGADRLAPARILAPAFASPVLIGAVTVLAVLVAVFLAYNANTGLPFVPTKELKVDIGDGSNLVVGNDVVEGGTRIGLVSAMKPVELSNGQVGAQLTLSLNESDGKVPVDSTVTVHPRSVLGTKFVQLTKGTSGRDFADGATLPITQTNVPVQIDDVFDTFNQPTRSAIQQDLVGFGDSLAGRGSALNDTISSLPALFGYLKPVAQYLSDPSTQLTRFFNSLEGFMGTVAPVAATNARLFTDMATTFEAFQRDPNALESTIAESPSTLDVSTASLRVQQPFLADLTTLGTNLTPATASLEGALPQLNPALEAGTKTLKRTPSLNANLQQVMTALKNLALAPGTNLAINALTATVGTLNPMVRYLGPYQTVCNDWNYWWTYLSNIVSEQTDFGMAQRALLNQGNSTQLNSISNQGATAPVNGGGTVTPTSGGNEYFHAPAYGAAIDNQGNADCENGQRGYPKQLNYFDPQHRDLDTDQHTPGDQGPTFDGRARVPAGETYSRNPTTGPQTAYNPSNP